MSMVACEKCGGTIDCICGSVVQPENDCNYSEIRPYLQHTDKCDIGIARRVPTFLKPVTCTCGLAKLDATHGRKA